MTKDISAKAQFKPVVDNMEDVLAQSRAVAGRAKPAVEQKATEEIKSNPFHKVMFDPALSLEEKQKTMAQALVYDKTLTDAQNEERLNNFVEFSDWLQSKRKELAIEMLKLNDSEAFSELKLVIDELGSGILDFNQKIAPFMAILDSLYKMQNKGVRTSDMLQEIMDDKAAFDALNEQLNQQTAEFEAAELNIRNYNDLIAVEKTKTSWYSLGTKIKPSAQAEINMAQLRIDEENQRLQNIALKIEGTKSELDTPRATQFEGLDDVKGNLKVLLDITSDEHRSKQKDLNTAAADFVSNSEKRVASVLTNIDSMNTRIDGASKNSSKVLGLYAVMNDAVSTAMKDNHNVLGTLDAPETEESLVAKMQREETREGALNHIKTLTGIKEETVKMYDGLSREKAELAGMLDSNDKQISATRYLHGSGIANMGMQLNAMITALGSAANGQSTKIAQELVDEMGSNAVMIRGKESLRAALAFQGTNETLERTIQLAAQSAELMRNASQVTAETLKEQQELLNQVKEGADNMQRAVTEGLEVYANETKAGNDNAKAVKKDDAFSNFNLG